jgi:hypothetical protein
VAKFYYYSGMRSFLLALALFAATLSAHAADARRFAVLSLIGDKLMIAQYFPNEGFRNDSSLRVFATLDDDVLDKTALQAVDQTLKRVDPSSKPILLVATDPTLFAFQTTLLDRGEGSKRLLERVMPMLKGSGATHLILVSKLRHEARVQEVKDTILGSGMLEGLGFYIDAGRAPPSQPTEIGAAVLGPFAYFRLELIDIAKGAVLREEKVVASRTFANSHTANPWANLTNAEKIAVLQDIIRRETANAVPRLVGAGARF